MKNNNSRIAIVRRLVVLFGIIVSIPLWEASIAGRILASFEGRVFDYTPEKILETYAWNITDSRPLMVINGAGLITNTTFGTNKSKVWVDASLAQGGVLEANAVAYQYNSATEYGALELYKGLIDEQTKTLTVDSNTKTVAGIFFNLPPSTSFFTMNEKRVEESAQMLMNARETIYHSNGVTTEMPEWRQVAGRQAFYKLYDAAKAHVQSLIRISLLLFFAAQAYFMVVYFRLCAVPQTQHGLIRLLRLYWQGKTAKELRREMIEEVVKQEKEDKIRLTLEREAQEFGVTPIISELIQNGKLHEAESVINRSRRNQELIDNGQRYGCGVEVRRLIEEGNELGAWTLLKEAKAEEAAAEERTRLALSERLRTAREEADKVLALTAKHKRIKELKTRAAKLANPMRSEIIDMVDTAERALFVADDKEFRRKIHEAEHALVEWEFRQLGRKHS